MFKKTSFAFGLGIILTFVAIKFIIPAYQENKAEQKLTKLIITDNILPTPFHAFGQDDTTRFISAIWPELASHLSDKAFARLYEKIQTKNSPEIKAAKQGILSNEAMADHLAVAGLLEQINTDKATALQAIKEINYHNHFLKPLGTSAQYYPTTPPAGPVRLPAEFEPIGAVLIGWPNYNPKENWDVTTKLVTEVASVAEAWVLVPNEYWQKGVEFYLTQKGVNLANVKFLHIPTDRIWLRDDGPTTVLTGPNPSPAFIWNPYILSPALPYFKFDFEVGSALATYLNVPVYRLPLVIEGGNIIEDGQGTVMVLESVYAKNPDVNTDQLKKIMKDYFGAERLITLPIVPGEVCGHIDMVVKFVDEDTVLVAEADKNHHWYNSLETIAKTLAETDAVTGAKYEVVRLPLPTTKNKEEWSYINSLTVNNKVIVPIYNAPEDEVALEIYKKTMPDYEIVGIDYTLYIIGAVHCQTKEVPKVLADRV